MKFKPYLIFFVVSVLAVITGLLIYNEQQTKIKSQIYSQLSYVSKVKQEQIINWINITVDHTYNSDQWLNNEINQFINSSADIETKNRIRNWFKNINSSSEYLDAYLLDTKMNVGLSLNNKPFLQEIDKKYFDSALTTRKPVLADFHKNNNHIFIGVITPLILKRGRDEKIIGFLLQIVNPKNSLYPLIKSWPTDARTAETLLIRVEGDSILYLTELLHKRNTEMNFKVSINKTEVPAVRAVKGYIGIFDGIDYRNIPVLAYVSNIQGSNWFMVTKVDYDEAMVPLDNYFLLLSSHVFVFILLSGIIIAYFWKKQQLLNIAEKYALQKIAEETAKKSLSEKEILLRELNHRTKNNMQIISSLISLKTSTFHDKERINALLEVKSKIMTIALVHEKLQHSANLSIINLKEYLTDLIYMIARSFTETSQNIKLQLELEEVKANIDTALACGLITNELISNSLKYAFPDNRIGFIKVVLKEINKNILYHIEDNGIGYKENDTEESLGLKLFRNIAEGQLGADIEENTDNGVSYRLTFKNTTLDEPNLIPQGSL